MKDKLRYVALNERFGKVDLPKFEIINIKEAKIKRKLLGISVRKWLKKSIFNSIIKSKRLFFIIAVVMRMSSNVKLAATSLIVVIVMW